MKTLFVLMVINVSTNTMISEDTDYKTLSGCNNEAKAIMQSDRDIKAWCAGIDINRYNRVQFTDRYERAK